MTDRDSRFPLVESMQAQCIESVIGALSDRDAAELRFNETLLNAVGQGVTYRRLAEVTGISFSALHKRANRARKLRPE